MVAIPRERIGGLPTHRHGAYDAIGRRTLAANTSGRFTSVYDAVNRVASTIAPAGKRVTYQYDSVNRRSAMIDPDGGRFTYSHDLVGRPAVILNPNLERTTSTYDALGRQSLRKLANGARTSFSYNADSNATGVSNFKSDGSTISAFAYSYDGAGRRRASVANDGTRLTWTYDRASQLVAEHRTGGFAYRNTFTYLCSCQPA
jgi:YD repeat-containing protein